MTERKKPQDHLPSKKSARRKALWFVTDFDTAEALEKVRTQDGLAGLLGKDAEQARQAKIDELEAELRKSSVKIVIRSMSRKRYEELLSEHPPTEEQLAEFKDQRQKPSFNYETYPIALVCASVIDPELPAEEMAEWFNSDAWSGGEFTQLFQECVAINSQSNVLILGKG
jgi:hypothetical protein